MDDIDDKKKQQQQGGDENNDNFIFNTNANKKRTFKYKSKY